MKKTYQLHLDFDTPILCFSDLKQIFEVLLQSNHIFIYSVSDDKYKQAAEDFGIDPAEKPFYVETSVSVEGTFTESVESWIENSLLDEFYNPEQRPHIDVLM